jgi:hypothetical protein
MDQTQGRRKKDNTMKEEITTKELVIQEVPAELIDIIHLLFRQGNFMCLKNP